MGKPRAKPAQPTVVKVVIREGPPPPAQAAAWKRLWALLLAPEKEAPGQAPQPAQGGEEQENDEAEPSKSG